MDAFLGRGWCFPPVLGKHGIQMSAYEEDIAESLQLLLSTSPGERVNRYDYGCPLHQYVFEPLTERLTLRMRNDIVRAITLFEPRVKLEDVSFEEQLNDDAVLIHITYTVIRTNNRNNIVYPFYFNEGTNIEKPVIPR